MKKSLIALAVLAASGAAMAQSSVTIYGIADIWFGSSKTSGVFHSGAAGQDGVRQTVLQSGGVSGSRFGFKGTEDLGGGLKANFLLEQGFSLDTGAATAGQAFSRQSYVGLSGGFGEVKLGKMWTAYDDISGATNSAFDSALAAANNVFLSNGYSANPANGVYYATPSFGGFSGAVSYAFGEDKTAALSSSNTVAFHAKYENGPIYAGVAYQRQKPQGSGASDKFTRINGSYDFGPAKLLASYGNVKEAGGEKTNEYHIGVDVPLGGALTLSGGYATSKTKLAGATDSKRSGYGIALAYGLSKRTTVYTGIHSSKSKDATGVEDGKATIYAVGLKHTF